MPRLKSGSEPGYYETSEYLIGKVAVSVIFLESNGNIDPNIEDWTVDEINMVISEIEDALRWWETQNPSAHATFTSKSLIVPTSYEPINRPYKDEKLWISEAMTSLGYPAKDYFTQVRDYVNDIRRDMHTDWSFVIFVVNSARDTDGKFTDGYSAYAYYGGPFLVMTYDVDGWGIVNMNRVAAHEIGHTFYATDEYDEKTEYSGYLNVSDVEGSGALMDKAELWLSKGTKEQIGWRDTDVDGILDIVDTFPKTRLTSLPPNLTDATTLTCRGSVEEVPYPNNNPHGTGRDVTINTIKAVRFRLNGGAWLNAVSIDGSFDSVREEFTFVTPNLPAGSHLLEVYSVNSVNNFEIPSVKNTFTVTFIIIDQSSISDMRADVGSTQEIHLRAVWAHNFSSLKGGSIFINGTGYVTALDGWVKISATSSKVGKQSWNVTGVKVGNITAYKQVAPSPEVIFDRIQLTITTLQERVEVGTKAPLTWTGRYEYDGEKFTGGVTLNEEPMKSSIGRFAYTVKDIRDPLYDLKTFVSNTVNVIFDRIFIHLQTETLTPGSIKPVVRLEYQFDDTSVVDAKVVIDSIESTNLGNGSYITNISTWSPYVTYNIQIDRSGFDTIRSSVSVFAFGNITIIGSIIGFLAVVIFISIRKAAKKTSVKN